MITKPFPLHLPKLKDIFLLHLKMSQLSTVLHHHTPTAIHTVAQCQLGRERQKKLT